MYKFSRRLDFHLAFFGTAAAVILFVIGANLFVQYDDLDSSEMISAAVDFQSKTHGPVSIPDDLSLPYKINLFKKENMKIDSLFFGASTLMGFEPSGVSRFSRAMNMSVNGNIMVSSIGAAELSLNYTSRIKYVAVALDWPLGFPFNYGTFDPLMARNPPPFTKIWRDLLSTSRIERTAATLLWRVFGDRSPVLKIGSIYKCSPDVTAMTFDVDARFCDGFKYDGSVMFFDAKSRNHLPSIKPETADLLVTPEGIRQSSYFNNLVVTQAKIPDVNYVALERLVNLTKSKGGEFVLLMPPMLPGLEQSFLKDPLVGPLVASFKNEIRKWAALHMVTVVDLNRSELYGCQPYEFGDGHHALTSCWEKAGSALN